MKHTLAAIAHWLESDDGAYPGNAAQLLRGVLADMEVQTAPAPQWTPSLPDPALAETLRQLRAENETLTGQLAEKRRAIEGMQADIERLGEDLRVVRKHRDTLSTAVGELTKENRLLLDDLQREQEAAKGWQETAAQTEAHNDALDTENRALTLEVAALKAAPSTAPANDTLPCADGDTAAPVDDERDDPAPDLLVSENEAVEIAEVMAPTKVRPARSSDLFELRGFTFRAPPSVCRLLDRLNACPATMSELVSSGVSANKDALSVLLNKSRVLLADASGGVLGIENSKKGVKLGPPGHYTITDTRNAKPAETPSPNPPTSAQDEGDSGESPRQEADDAGIGDGLSIAARESAPFVTSLDPGEGARAPIDPAPAADGEVNDFVKIQPETATPAFVTLKEATTFLPPEAVRLTSPVTRPANVGGNLPNIKPGNVIGVDIKQRMIRTAKGHYVCGSPALARALDKLKGGDMFDYRVIAKAAAWKTPEIAKTAIAFEINRLKEHGVAVWSDKFNVRLRVAG